MVNLSVYIKNLKKSWIIGIVPPLLVTSIVPLLAGVYPELKAQIEVFEDILQNPVYQAFLGQLGGLSLGTWLGMYAMYIFLWFEFIMLFIVIFVPGRLISSEVDKKTLDIMLTYPIPRWKYLLEKFAVYLTYNILYLVLMLPISWIITEFMEETLDYMLLAQGLIAIWFLLFALGSISLLCSTLFLDTQRTMVVAGLLIIGMYIGERFAGLVESTRILQNLSLFHYINPGAIISSGTFPLDELAIVTIIGIVATALAAYIFEYRDLAY